LRIALPDGGLALSQLCLTAIDIVAAGAALWILLPGPRVDFATFSAVFAVATALGVISHVPGGIGVFEAVVVFALGRHVSPTHVAAALLTYRGIYFALPLLLAAVLLAGFELRRLDRARTSGAGGQIWRDAGQLAPTFLSVITFAIGTMLLVSGATPVFGTRLQVLHETLPLWAVETSNFVASLTGVVLLFVARGLFHRLDGAWWLAVVIAVTNLALSLAKGLAIGESVVIGCLVLLLVATRRRFGRPTSFLRQPFGAAWFTATGMVIAASAWILFFAFRDVQYTHELWWQFEFDAQAPRAFRAILGAAILALGAALWQLLRPATGRVARPTTAEMAQARRIIAQQERSDAMLGLMGDKSFLFSASGRSLLMYAKHGRSWVALYDPIGPRDEWPEMIWQFIELADAHGGRVAFYEIKPDSLPLYLDAGLKVMKLGEEARIVLSGFTTAGSEGAALRYTLKRGEREGFELEILAPGEAERSLDQLVSISDDWLALRKTREKGFSVAAFEPEFVASQVVALLRQAGRPIAFVTVMTTGLRGEATVGLMRHTADASGYAMEYIFTRVGLYLKEAGFAVFSLGMAPLAGFGRATPLSSTWHRFARLLWEHGGRLYRFQGLRAFKSKFHPVWEPRYLAASGSIGPLVALTDVVALANGGRDRDR
jgi:phosphatidylglycerol lysyltransferase